MNTPFPLPSGESRQANLFSAMGTAIAALLILVGLPTSSYAQAAGLTITQVAFKMPTELEAVLKDLHDGAQGLVGSPVASPKASAFADEVSAHLRKNGYPFATARATSDPANPGRLTVAVAPGKIGVGNVDGNAWLSSEGILKSILWTEGEIFHYGKFQSAASTLNRNRFVNVDSKLRPRRADNGEIIVDADFQVEDSLPVVYKARIANDGTEESSGWRASAGFDFIEPFADSDKFSFNWLTDAENLNSYSSQYSGTNNDNFSWVAFLGYSDSEYDQLISPVSLDISGEGLHAGFLLSHKFAQLESGSVSWNFGLTYLDLTNRVSFGGYPVSDQSLAFVVPRIGLQGVIDSRAFWSLSLLTDAGSSDDVDLSYQRPGASSGFFATQFTLAALQRLSFQSNNIDWYFNLAGQLANDPLPASLQKAIGGVNTVRGYKEREAYGDHGVHFNTELRFGSAQGRKISNYGVIHPLFFYDFGYVASEDSLSAKDDATTMHSLGAGVRCNFKSSVDVGLHLGVPLKDTADSAAKNPRAHFSFDFRF
jgi:hemolysin activation/secretion protein